MHRYTIELFLHVTGAIALFVAYGTLLFGATALRYTKTVEQVRAIAAPLVAGRRVGFESISVIGGVGVAGVLVLIVTGVDMASTAWNLRLGWIDAAIATVVLVAPLGPFVIGRRLDAIARMADESPDGPIPQGLSTRIHDPVLATALYAGITILLGIVFLMTNKPPLSTSIIVMVIALVLGFATGLPAWNAARAMTRPAQP
jgi:hypothetical protein